MPVQFKIGDGQYFHNGCEYCCWMYKELLRLIGSGENTELFDRFYLRYMYGRGADVRGRQVEEEEEMDVLEPLWEFAFNSMGRQGWEPGRKI